ncbi:hypothetical protein ACFXDE_35375 [Kitasatospora sp. NPDC059408]|uniref:hypothetical protein n=1 Tax=Kitasatospora sp. NPDC059408 TaxID=3346823 RepID=UPI00368D0A80
MEERSSPPGGLRGKARTAGMHLRRAYEATGTWLQSPAGRFTVRIAVDLLKLYVRVKGIDTELPSGTDPLER